MIIVDDSKDKGADKDATAKTPLLEPNNAGTGVPGPSNIGVSPNGGLLDANASVNVQGTADAQLPAFEDAVRDAAVAMHELGNGDVFVPPGGEEPPPEFTPYEAEYFETNEGTVVSHDRHLNEDGEALYRFLLAHAQRPPKFLLSVRGDHTESRRRRVQRRDANGRTHWHTETEEVPVVDFDFTIDISQHVASTPIHWSIPDSEPAFRGKMYEEVDAPPLLGRVALPGPVGTGAGEMEIEMGERGQEQMRRQAAREELKSAKAWNHERQARGLPPWIGPETGWSVLRPADALVHQTHANVLNSSKTLREWADEYCASPKMLKEFTYEKIVYGWNCAALEAAVTSAVQSTYYNGKLSVKFVRRATKIHVRADNWLSRALSHTWVKVLLWITLLYPFIWLFKRFAAEGGGRWEVCGGAYALKAWQFVTPPPPPLPAPGAGGDGNGDAPPDYGVADASVVQTDQGAARLVGVREGEWFAMWEGSIKRAVNNRLKTRTPLAQPSSTPTTAALILDGYVRQPDAF